MNIRMPQLPTFNAHQNVTSFEDAKKHKKARAVIAAVMDKAGRAQRVAEDDGRENFDDFPEAGISGQMRQDRYHDSIEFVRFYTKTGEIQEFGFEFQKEDEYDNTVEHQLHFKKLPLGYQFTQGSDGKSTVVRLTEQGTLAEISNGWNEGF